MGRLEQLPQTTPSIEDVVGGSPPRGLDNSEAERLLVDLAEQRAVSLAAIAAAFKSAGDIPFDGSASLTSRGLVVPREWEDVWASSAFEFAAAKDPTVRGFFGRYYKWDPVPTHDDLKGLDEALPLLTRECEIATANLERQSRDLGMTSAVQSFWPALWVLLCLALLLVVFPLSLMAIRPVPSGPVVRTLVVLAFVLGFGVLAAYLVATVRRIGKRSHS